MVNDAALVGAPLLFRLLMPEVFAPHLCRAPDSWSSPSQASELFCWPFEGNWPYHLQMADLFGIVWFYDPFSAMSRNLPCQCVR